MSKAKGLFIAGQWKSGSGPLFTSRNPATGEVVWEGCAANNNDIDAAVESARKSFNIWSLLPIEKRIEFLNAYGEALKKSQILLTETLSKETGKPLWEARTEVQAMIGKIAISVEAHYNRCPDVQHPLSAGTSLTHHKPHGAVAVFGPFNFPGHLPNGHIVPALLAGNTVIFKPSELAPAVAEQMISCWQTAGLPAGVLNLLHGGRDTGAYLASHPLIDGLFFTGSWPTGRALLEKLAAQPEKILALEMGGNNPLIVTHVNNMQAAAYLTIQSAYLTAGQRCTCARRLIVPQGVEGDQFLEALIEMIGKITVGPYTDQPEPYMGPVITAAAATRILQEYNALQKNGGIPLVKMRLLKPGTGLLSPCLMDVTEVSDRRDEEIFGPFLQVIRVLDFEHALIEANNTIYGLSAGLFSDKNEDFAKFYTTVRAGVLNWNAPLTGASSAAPFGGIRRSGNHRPSAYYAADYCSYPVASIINDAVKMPSNLTPGLSL
jgi:succinylglutamic semialdehyde dehydrogenase